MAEIAKLELKYRAAMDKLAQAVAKAYPVGAEVWVRWGRGRMLATVCFPPTGHCDPTRIGIRSPNSGEVHWKDIQDCELA